MAFTRSPDRPPRTKRTSVSSRRNAIMKVGESIDLRILFGEQTRYQCPPCAVYFSVPPTVKVGVSCTCTKCGSVYVVSNVTSTGTVMAFGPAKINRPVKDAS